MRESVLNLVTTHQLSHRRSGTNTGEKLIVLRGQHFRTPLIATIVTMIEAILHKLNTH
jgi:hypothetical protein